MTDQPYRICDPANAAELPTLSISELSQLLRSVVEQTFHRVRVRGEISGHKKHTSGHHYLALKDAESVMDAVIWRGTRLPFAPQDGLEIVAQGRLTTYPGRSKYQMIIESFEIAGEGALLKLLEDRKRTLWGEGLFAPERKKPIPFLPRVIAVVTSPTGAVIRDIVHRLADRFPRHVLLWPVPVQGDGAAERIAQAIEGLNTLLPTPSLPAPDLIIVARGGGSLEDLWAFNEEIVVRAAANSRIPLISAVGHETDTTLIDLAADLRCPTPTAAAERAVPVRQDLIHTTDEWSLRLRQSLRGLVLKQKTALEHLEQRWPTATRLLGERQQRLDDAADRLRSWAGGWLKQHHHTLQTQSKLLESASFQRVLARGFALVQKQPATEGGRRSTVTSAQQLLPLDRILLTFHDGTSEANITSAPGSPRSPHRRKKSVDDNGQLSWIVDLDR